MQLATPASRHISTVLRLKSGASLTLFNGLGGEYSASLISATKHQAIVQIINHQAIERESPWPLCLALCTSKGAKMDLSIQKATELGATRIQPLMSSRSVVRLDPDRARQRQHHWQSIVIHASEQCGRNRLAEISPVHCLDDWLDAASQTGLKLLFSPTASHPLSLCPGPDGNGIWLLIGPEGGLASDEIKRAVKQGFIPVSFGSRILRAETAAIAAVAAVTALWGG